VRGSRRGGGALFRGGLSLKAGGVACATACRAAVAFGICVLVNKNGGRC
jgi:hypothetical protein